MMVVTPNEALRHMIDLLSPESQYVAYHALDAIEAQLAEANEMRLAEANEMRLADLEAELAAAQEDARLQRANKRIAELEAQCAAMREAFDAMRTNAVLIPSHNTLIAIEMARKALAPDAGKALLERLRKAEAERVEAYSKYEWCRYSGCGAFRDGECKAIWKHDSCEAYKFHDYLRNHRMIREAE